MAKLAAQLAAAIGGKIAHFIVEWEILCQLSNDDQTILLEQKWDALQRRITATIATLICKHCDNGQNLCHSKLFPRNVTMRAYFATGQSIIHPWWPINYSIVPWTYLLVGCPLSKEIMLWRIRMLYIHGMVIKTRICQPSTILQWLQKECLTEINWLQSGGDLRSAFSSEIKLTGELLGLLVKPYCLFSA